MNRLNNLSGQLTGAKRSNDPVMNSLEWFGAGDLMGEKASKLQKHLRPVLEAGILDQIIPYINKAEFPEELVDLIKSHKLGHYFLSGKYGNGANDFERGVIISELARCDVSTATLFMVQMKLLGRTIELYGSEAQKEHYLPKIRDFDLIGGWALTELDNGSDASGITTNVVIQDGHYVLNGNKRWIGNANKDILVVFARNLENKQVEAFIVHLDEPGVTRSMIPNKMALRAVQNGQIYFQNVKIPANRKLPGVKGFASVAKLLAESRMAVAWVAAGVGLGCYDFTMKYVTERKQFGRPLTAFQLIQDKIVKIMGLAQSSFLIAWQAQNLATQGKATIGRLAFAKATTSKFIREAARLGREALGGNGILLENYLMKALVDMEVIYTYEGTYDINTLVTARELTGIAAFKAR